jgi:DNA-binding Lrp family transcriptional regulator
MPTQRDKAIIRLICQDIPLVKEPFGALARKLGMRQEEFLERIRAYKKNGFLRKLSAALNHRTIGFRHNAMAVWNIPRGRIDKAGGIMASCAEVSHCYQRKRSPGWKYNLYTMIHGKTKRECFDVVRGISRKTACRDYDVLFTRREYKKSAAIYFKDKDERTF